MLCFANLWRYWCRSSPKLEMDINDSEFGAVVSRIKKKKSYFSVVLPPQKEKKKVLVLDLDETLIHSSFTKPSNFDYES